MADAALGGAAPARAAAGVRATLGRTVPVLLALAIGALLILVTGNSPAEGAQALWQGAFGSASATAGTLILATPLIFSALAFSVALHGGMFNAGTEGQIVIGAFTGALAGFGIEGLPALVHVPLTLGAGMLGGAAWALLPGIWRLWFGATEIVTTLMLNFVAVLLNDYLVAYPFRDPASQAGTNIQTAPLLDSARLPSLWTPYRLTAGLILALLLAAGLWWLLYRTVVGYELRMAGTAARAAEAAGIASRRRMLQAMLASGAVAGLAGAVQVAGVFYADISPFTAGLGFTGVVVSLVVGNRPLAIPAAALLFAALQSGAIGMEATTSISRYIVGAVVAIVVLFVSARSAGLRALLASALRRGAGASQAASG